MAEGGIFNNEIALKILFVFVPYAGWTRDIFANFRGSVDRAELF